MWNAAGAGGAFLAAMLAVGGVSMADEPAMPDTGTSVDVEKQKQSGSDAHPLSHIRGENARKLQETLKAQGFYDGTIDGVLGPTTKEALVKFQESKGFAASGAVDAQTASALGLELSDVQPVRGTEPVKPAAIATPVTETGLEATDESEVTSDADPMDSDLQPSEIEPQSGTNTTFDKATIQEVKKALKAKRLFTGKVDGVLDADTLAAIRRFQTDNGIVVTGLLDARTLDALGVKTKAVPDAPPAMTTPAPSEVTTPGPEVTPVGTPFPPIDVPHPNHPAPTPGSITPP